MPIRHKRAMLAATLGRSGALAAIERLARRPRLTVLCYHRIGDPTLDDFYSPLISATPEGFRQHVRMLRDRYRLLRLDEAIESAQPGFRSLREPCALITFDDGYRDNLDAALPILRELGAPAAFFPTTGFLDGRLPWWDRIAYAIKRANVDRIGLDRPEPIEVDLGDDRAAALARLIRAFWRLPRPDDEDALAHLEDRAGRRVPADAARSLLMDWGDARRLASLGPDYAIGAHTLTHPRLSALPEFDQRHELIDAKQKLESELGRPVEAVAYPYGLAADFDAATARLAREAGYRAAFALTPGPNRPGAADAMALNRLAVGGADTAIMIRARMTLTSALGRSPV